MPGFGPAAELAPWRVPKGATVVVEAKVAKTSDAPPALIRLDGRKEGEGAPTRYAQTRPAD